MWDVWFGAYHSIHQASNYTKWYIGHRSPFILWYGILSKDSLKWALRGVLTSLAFSMPIFISTFFKYNL